MGKVTCGLRPSNPSTGARPSRELRHRAKPLRLGNEPEIARPLHQPHMRGAELGQFFGVLLRAGEIVHFRGIGFQVVGQRLDRAPAGPLGDEHHRRRAIEEIRGRGITWVEPELVVQVGFTEWTRDGRLRHPRFLGVREDKDAREVVREVPS